MPIVRELINRVSFKVKPGDKENAEKSFGKIKSAAKGVIAVITGITAAGTKMFTDFERDTASVKFFSRTNEEAEKLLDAINEIRGEGIISKRERAQAAAILAELTAPLEIFKDSLSILKDISIAQPKLDFPKTVQLFAEFVKTGDIESLRQLGAVGKDLAEQLTIANVSIEQSVKGQINRAELLTQELEKQKTRIKELANEQKNTLLFGFRQMSKEASDFTFKFGKEISPDMKEVIGLIRDMLKELNESKSFWDTVKITAETIASTLKLTKSILEVIFPTGKIEKFIEREKELSKQPGIFERFLGISPEVSEAKRKSIIQESGFKMPSLSQLLGVRSEVVAAKAAAKRDTDEKTINLNLSGRIEVEGRNLQGADISQLGQGIQSAILERFKEANRNIIAKSGNDVGIGGIP